MKRDFEFWAWASHFIMIWNITVRGLIISRMPNMQGLCPYYLKDHMKAMLYWQICGFIFQILAQWIDSKIID